MIKYPIRIEDKAAGAYVRYNETVKMINAAFYEVFMMTIPKTPEEVEGMEIEDRITCCLMAMKKSAVLTKSKKPPFPVEGVQNVHPCACEKEATI